MITGALFPASYIAIAIFGQMYSHFFVGLMLLGVGWNFLYLEGATRLTEVYLPTEKSSAIQGINEFAIFATTTLTTLSSGYLHHVLGWEKLNQYIIPVVGFAACMILLFVSCPGLGQNYLIRIDMKYSMLTILCATGLLVASKGLAHHSDAGLDMRSYVNFDGVVTEYSWRNPHVYIGVETTNKNGDLVEWALQTSSTITLSRIGWTRDSLSPGEQVTVVAHPAQSGRAYGLLNSLEKADGTRLGSSFYSVSGEPKLKQVVTNVRADSLEGKWLADGDKLVDYPGGFDGFFRAEMVLNEKGKLAQAAFVELSSENPESTCIGRPTPGMLLSTVIYPLEIAFQDEHNTITLHSEYFDDLRIVYMDKRAHPDPRERFTSGYSTGRWEDDVLVIDTRNFADHRSPYQIGVPSGSQKRVIEKFRLIDGGARAIFEFILEDAEYLSEPLIHSREMIYSPHMEMSRFDCDTESTSRFLP